MRSHMGAHYLEVPDEIYTSGGDCVSIDEAIIVLETALADDGYIDIYTKEGEDAIKLAIDSMRSELLKEGLCLP